MRRCAWCAAPLVGLMPHAVVCSPKCRGERQYDKDREKYAARYAENRETKLAYQKARYEANPEQKRDYWRQYRLDNRGKVRADKIVARGETHGCITDASVAALLANEACIYCGEPSQEIDHVDPLSLGGANCIANLAMACAKCNRAKHVKPLEQWRPDLVEVVRGKLAHCPIEVHCATR